MKTTAVILDGTDVRPGMLEQMREQLNKEEMPIYDSYFINNRKQIGKSVKGTAKVEGEKLVCEVEFFEGLTEVTTIWRKEDGWIISLESENGNG
jgi:hypothetical protein